MKSSTATIITHQTANNNNNNVSDAFIKNEQESAQNQIPQAAPRPAPRLSTQNSTTTMTNGGTKSDDTSAQVRYEFLFYFPCWLVNIFLTLLMASGFSLFLLYSLNLHPTTPLLPRFPFIFIINETEILYDL